MSAPSCTWFLMIGIEFVCTYVHQWNFWPFFQHGPVIEIWFFKQNCKIAYVLALPNEICDTYPESSWYKLLKNARKSWNNHKSNCTLLDICGQKYSKTDTVYYLRTKSFWYTVLQIIVLFCWIVPDIPHHAEARCYPKKKGA